MNLLHDPYQALASLKTALATRQYIFPDKPLHWLVRLPPKAWQGKLLVYGPDFQPKGLRHLTTIYAGSTLCVLWSR